MRVVFEQNAISLVSSQNFRTFTKEISFVDLERILLPRKEESTGLLPPNTRWIKYGENGRVTLVIEVPAGFHTLRVRHDANLFGGKEFLIEKVPLPTAIMVISVLAKVDGYSYSSCRLAAIAKPYLDNLEEPLFRYPLPNIDTSFHMCWGSAQTNHAYSNLASLEYLAKAYFRSYFNDHMWTRTALSKEFDWSKIPEPRAVEVYMQELASLGEFRSEWLLPTPKKLSDLLSIAK